MHRSSDAMRPYQLNWLELRKRLDRIHEDAIAGKTVRVEGQEYFKVRELHDEGCSLAQCKLWDKLQHQLELSRHGIFESLEQNEMREFKNMHAEGVSSAEWHEHTDMKGKP